MLAFHSELHNTIVLQAFLKERKYFEEKQDARYSEILIPNSSTRVRCTEVVFPVNALSSL